MVREGGQENYTIPICGRRNRGSNAVDLLLLVLSFNNRVFFSLHSLRGVHPSSVISLLLPPAGQGSQEFCCLPQPLCRDEILEVHLKILRFLSY